MRNKPEHPATRLTQRGDAELALMLVLLVLFIGLILAACAVGSNYYGKYQCANYQEITGIQTKYAAFDTCYIKTAEGWQRWDEYLKRSAASEGLKGIGK